MGNTKLRSSSQLYVDAALDIQTQQIINVVDPTAAQHVATKNYVDALVAGVVAGADAMVFKGTIGTGGTHTIAAFNALAVYNAGWTYRVIEAGTIKGRVAEIGDLFLATVDRASGGVDADWTVAQTNIDGAVIKADYDAQTILAATTDNTPVALTVTEQTFVGRKTGGNIQALSATEARAILNVADGANNYVHPNHSGDVTSAGDGAQTIATNAVTNAKAAQMANSTMKGRVTAGTGNAEDLTVAQIKTLLSLNTNNQSSRTYRATPVGTINGSNTDFTIAQTVLSGTEEVFKNGLLMNAGVGNDYTVTYAANLMTITFAVAPQSTPYADVILVNHSV